MDIDQYNNSVNTLVLFLYKSTNSWVFNSKVIEKTCNDDLL